jgi:hypothetical protein
LASIFGIDAASLFSGTSSGGQGVRERLAPAALFAWGTAAAALAIYVVCRIRLQQTHHRMAMLESELELRRARDEANQQALTKVLEAMNALRASTEEQLERLRERADQLRTDQEDGG